MLGLGLLVLTTSLPALAQGNPYEAEQQRLADATRRAGASPRAMLSLLELDRSFGNVPAAITLAHFERIAADRRLAPATRAYARWLVARTRTRMGDPDAEDRELHALGYVHEWRVIGPFDNEGKTGFDRADPPEARRMEPLEADASYPGRERAVSWRAYPEVTRGGYVSFDAPLRPRNNVCGYAETFVTSERAQALSLWIGGGGATRVWWNGEVVHQDAAYRGPHPDRAVAMVGAHAGPNRVLVKTCVTDGAWGFYLRIGDARGEPGARGVVLNAVLAPEDVARVRPGHGAPLPRAPLAPFAALSEAGGREGASAQALEDLARFLVWTGADDPAEGRARDLAARAAEAEPTVERLGLAASLATQRGVAMRFLARARAIAPNDARTLLFSANLASGGPSPEDALPLVDRLPRGTTQWMSGALLASSILSTLGLGEAARARVEEAAALAPGASRWVAARANAAGSVTRRDEMIALRRALLALAYDDLGSRRVLIDDALTRGATDEVLDQLAVYERLAASHTGTYTMAAEIYEAIGRVDEALAALRRGLEMAPEEAALHVAQGHVLLRAGQRDAGAAVLREALALRPQDAATRELLEDLEPEERRDEAYALGAEELLARRREAGGYPLSVLQDLSVTTVFESGLGSRFRQVAVQIHDAEGARQYRTFPIQYDPDVQRVEIRQARVLRGTQRMSAIRTVEQSLGEPWYRIYYDTRALVVILPDLEPGDVVEVQYRVDDVAPRNLFHDYFGALTYLQRTVPLGRLDYVLITPRGRAFHFNEPSMPGLTRDVREEGELRIHRYLVEDVPALRPEPSMPGMTELVPYLHVSTYRTWEDVGRWYWGLIRDQLHPDEDLRRTVRELVAGAPDTRTKVQRIYDWVIRNTRYVGLEFGIHGFLPYRVTDIVDRGFGDCKDKASLIYVMLREAGIDARIVLTRTRRNGQIHDLPASLAVFDHAIAYVPELDLYLDGTAEFSGIDELPRMDQGVTVLRVGPDDVVLARTPVLPSDAARRTREVELELSADGSGRVAVREVIVGVDAPGFRSRFQAEGLRRERLERQARTLFPGVELGELSFERLDDFNAPVELRFRATAPTLAVRDGPALRVAPTVLDDLSGSLARASDRRLPLELGGRSSYVEDRRVRLPAGWRVAELPQGGVAESRFGRLSIEVERQGAAVRARTTFSIETDRVAPEEYREFRQWVEQADRILRQRLVVAPGGES